MSDHRGKPQRIGDVLFETCPKTGKIRHETEAAARDHAAALLSGTGDRVRVFLCSQGDTACRGWHVGHRARNAGKRGRRG